MEISIRITHHIIVALYYKTTKIKKMPNNVGHGKMYEQSDWGPDAGFHLKTIIKYATQALQRLVKFTVDTTKSFISSIKETLDQTIKL